MEDRDHLYFHQVEEWVEGRLLPLVIHLISLLRKIHSVILFRHRHFRELLMGRVVLSMSLEAAGFPLVQDREVDNGWKLVG